MQRVPPENQRLDFGPGPKMIGLFVLISFLFLPALYNNYGVKAETNYSLRFYGHGVNDIDRVKIKIDNPAVPSDVGGNFTLEFWMKASLANNNSNGCTTGNDNWITGNIIFDRDINGPGDFGDYGVSMAGGHIAFGVNNGSTGSGICSTISVADNQWHHVAVTRNQSNGQMRIYIDGQKRGENASGPSGDLSYRNGRSGVANDPYLVIGAEKHDFDKNLYPSYNGFIDEVRISNYIRYSSNFTRPSAPFTADANTAALYHFNEGPAGACTTGQVIQDSSGASGGPSNGVCRYGGSGTPGPVYSTDTPFGSSPPTPTSTPTVTPTPDTVAPIISNVVAQPLDTNVIVTWDTNEGATSRVEYGIGSPTSSTLEITTYDFLHHVFVDGLMPGTNYECQVYSKDAAGNQAISQSCDFSTFSPEELARIYLPFIMK